MDNEDGLFEVVTTTAGAVSIRNNRVGEIMHNPVGPWKEANLLYIDQSALIQKLQLPTSTPLVVFDVGLGAAANALATLHWAKKFLRPVEIVSFEIDLRLARFALENSQAFSHIEENKVALQQVLESGLWQQEHIRWTVFEGDFLDTISETRELADIVFYDPYSPQKNPEMWTTSCFRKLRNKCKNRAEFFNYSQATPIRAALLESGFFVGYGVPIGEKETTTQAAYDIKDLKHPLGSRWLQRWRNSSTPLPFQCQNPERTRKAIQDHAQFQALSVGTLQ